MDMFIPVQEYSILLSSTWWYCGRQISCHKAGKLDDKGCEIRLFNSDAKYRNAEILEADSKEFKQCIQSFTEEEAKETEEPFRDIFKSYDLRTKFFSIFEIKDVAIFSYKLKNLIGELKESGIKECIKLGKHYQTGKKK